MKYLGPFPGNANSKTDWICSCGARYRADYHSVARGCDCRRCGYNKRRDRITERHYHEKAHGLGHSFNGPVPETAATKTSWRCKNGHIWETTYDLVCGCPHCPTPHEKIDADYHTLAESLDFEWLGPSVENTDIKTRWQCPNGHTIESTYSNLKANRSCIQCSPVRRKTIDDYISAGNAVSMSLIDPMPAHVHVKVRWICRFGHITEKSYSNISRGHGCKHCVFEKQFARPSTDFVLDRSKFSGEWTSLQSQIIRRRDSHRCLVCGYKKQRGEKRLPVHHIIPRRFAPDWLRNIPENLITLCPLHHIHADRDLLSSVFEMRDLLSRRYGYSYRDNPLAYLPEILLTPR